MSHTPKPPLSLDSEGDIIDADGQLLAVTTVAGKKLAPLLIEALETFNLLRELNMGTVAVALEYIGQETWQAYDTMNNRGIADGETPLQTMQAAKKVLTEVTP